MMNGWMTGWINGWMTGWINGWMTGEINGWMTGEMDRLPDWLDDIPLFCDEILTKVSVSFPKKIWRASPIDNI